MGSGLSKQCTQKRHSPIPMQEKSKLPQFNKLQVSEIVKFNSAHPFALAQFSFACLVSRQHKKLRSVLLEKCSLDMLHQKLNLVLALL